MSRRCIIITSYLETSIRNSVNIVPDDFVICADGGMSHAIAESVVPDVVIGDFDSSNIDEIKRFLSINPDYSEVELIQTVPEKDDTDTLMCVKHGMGVKHGTGAMQNTDETQSTGEMQNAGAGCDEFIIVGGLGGRLDHTIANIQILSFLLDEGRTGMIVDGQVAARIIEGPDEIELKGNPGTYFSIYSFSEECTGIYEINSKYTLDNATLSHSFPVGTSNEFLDGPAVIKIGTGKLLVIKS